MTDPRVEANGVPKKSRGRSPSYPAIDLETAVQRARKLWEEERQHPASVETIIKHWGYRSFNGPASLTLAALKKFGLTDDEGTGTARTARVSDLAVGILANPDERARVAAIQRAALMPKVHNELWEKYGDNLPSDANLHWELTRQRGFTETGAREFVRQYRATMEHAQLVASDSTAAQTVEDKDDDESLHAPLLPPTKRHPVRSPSRRGGMSESGTLTIPVPVVGGSPITIEGEFPVSERAWTQFIAVLQAMKPGLVVEPTEDESVD